MNGMTAPEVNQLNIEADIAQPVFAWLQNFLTNQLVSFLHQC